MSCFIHKISPNVIKRVYECKGCGKEFIPKPVTAVSEGKCARCKGSLNWEGTCCYKCTLELTDPQKEEQKGNLRRRCKCHEIKDGDMLETCEDCDGVKKVMPAKEQKGCCQCPEPKRDLSSAVVPFTCPCSCHKSKAQRVIESGPPEEIEATTNFYAPDSPQEKCTCEGSFVHPCHYCKTGKPCVTDAKDPCPCSCHKKQCDACDFGSCLVHNTERKEKHCFCGNLSDPNYAHHPKECVFIGSYTEDRPLVKTQIADSLQEKCCCGHPENKNYSYHGKDYCQPFNMFPKEEKDYYTRAEIDAMFQKEEITCDSRFERSKMPSEEEREFRKALLEFLTIPNIGFTKGELISKLELEKKFADLKSRFL